VLKAGPGGLRASGGQPVWAAVAVSVTTLAYSGNRNEGRDRISWI
jgi:hypothetical protein